MKAAHENESTIMGPCLYDFPECLCEALKEKRSKCMGKVPLLLNLESRQAKIYVHASRQELHGKSLQVITNLYEARWESS